MKKIRALIARNIKIFFKDKGMFFTSLITPVILLVLYGTFLADVYKDSFTSGLPSEIMLSDKVVNGLVGGQLISSILAVSCVTVAFCSSFLMVQDKSNGTLRDLLMTAVKPYELSVGYYAANLITTLIICFCAFALCLVYVFIIGWYMSIIDVLLLLLDVVLLSLFGTVLASIVNLFLSTQGQISAVGTIVSSGYGFISGAYMPISSFADGLQKVISFLPGTYGTSLMRNHAMRGGIAELEKEGIPKEAIDGLRDAMDCNLYFFDMKVPEYVMYLILIGATVLLVAAYLLVNMKRKKR